MSLSSLVLHLIFPVKCMFCGKLGESLCSVCAEKMADSEPFSLCLKCGLPAPCKTHKNRYSVISLALHKDRAREAVLALKYGRNPSIGSVMGKTMGRFIEKPQGDEWFVTPVPLHRSSARKYNQALWIARGLAYQWKFPLIGGLSWSMDREPQSLSDSAGRRSLPPDAISWMGGNIAKKKIVLVDDVRTTGTTLMRCSRVLYDMGADKVLCVTWSRSPYCV